MNSDNHIKPFGVGNYNNGKDFQQKNNLTREQAFNILLKEFLRIKKLENQKLNE